MIKKVFFAGIVIAVGVFVIKNYENFRQKSFEWGMVLTSPELLGEEEFVTELNKKNCSQVYIPAGSWEHSIQIETVPEVSLGLMFECNPKTEAEMYSELGYILYSTPLSDSDDEEALPIVISTKAENPTVIQKLIEKVSDKMQEPRICLTVEDYEAVKQNPELENVKFWIQDTRLLNNSGNRPEHLQQDMYPEFLQDPRVERWIYAEDDMLLAERGISVQRIESGSLEQEVVSRIVENPQQVLVN